MEEKKYATLKTAFYSYNLCSYHTDEIVYNLPGLLSDLNKQFINKEQLKDKINKAIYRCEISLNDQTLKKNIFDFRKGIWNGFEQCLKLLEE